ncbi:MAG: betaine--homocysteine S-methyltransferase [Anaerolineales bacterium]|jgi:5-methyltetrahydrofolate--homocysteine methyltransferase
MRTSFEKMIKQADPLLLDGAMGTMLFSSGLEHGGAPELWNVEAPDKIKAVHEAYIAVGSRLILTNTFGGTPMRLEMHGLAERAEGLNRAGAELAGEVAEQADAEVVVAGSMGPSGGILEPYGEMAYDQAVESFRRQAEGLVQGGVDVLWVETMSDLGEVKAAVEGARLVTDAVPIVATMTFDTHGRTMMGVTPEQALQELSSLDLVALGANCGNGTDEIVTVIEKMTALNPDKPLVAKANAGIPHVEDGVVVYDATPEIMAGYAKKVYDLGARLIGGCCGSTPDHLAAMRSALEG